MVLKGVALSAALLAAAAASPAFCAEDKYARRAEINFPGKAAVKAEVVWTPQDTRKGLMFREKMPQDHGMLFVFEVEEFHTFWMKNTWLELDIIYIGADKRIRRIFPAVARSYPSTPDAAVARVEWAAMYVLEVNSGFAAKHKLAEGDMAVFDISPEKKSGGRGK